MIATVEVELKAAPPRAHDPIRRAREQQRTAHRQRAHCQVIVLTRRPSAQRARHHGDGVTPKGAVSATSHPKMQLAILAARDEATAVVAQHQARGARAQDGARLGG